MHDLDPVVILQLLRGMRAARHDRAIDLDRDPAFGQALLRQQTSHRAGSGQVGGFAIEVDAHAAIVPDHVRGCSQRERAGASEPVGS